MINSNKYCFQLDQLKAELDKKHLELVNRKHVILHQDNTKPHVSLMTGHTLELDWEVLKFTRHCTFGFPFIVVFTKFSYWKNILIPWRTVRGTWNSSLFKKKALER